MFKKITENIKTFFCSKNFFFVVIGLLVVQAVWFAICARYPMAFDENYHFGIIKIYSKQLLPFIKSTPANSGAFGDITRYDSYLYHYLMSFPYRFIEFFTKNELIQIIILRFINIGMFVAGLFLFRKTLRDANIKEPIINFSFLMLIFIPIVPFLAATISYDNLAFVFAPLVVDLAILCINQIKAKHEFPIKYFILMLIFGSLGSLVKYAFLPIFVAAFLYVIFILIRSHVVIFKNDSIIKQILSFKKITAILLCVGLIVSFGLIIERYGVNLAVYHKLEPDCGEIHPTEHCIQYGPWARNYNIKQNIVANDPNPDPSPIMFIPVWASGMFYRLYFAITYNYSNDPPLPLPFISAIIVASVGLVLCLIFFRKLLRSNNILVLFGLIIIIYTASLFYVNLSEYIKYREALALNGRYFIIIMPLIFAWLASAYEILLGKIFRRQFKNSAYLFAIVLLLLTVQGGGMLTYLVRSKGSWYFQDKSIVSFNMSLKKTISPLIVGGEKNGK